jgi:hypothetical protein
MGSDMQRRGTDQQIREAPTPPGSEHEKVSVLGLFEEHSDRLALLQDAMDVELRVDNLENFDGLVQEPPSRVLHHACHAAGELRRRDASIARLLVDVDQTQRAVLGVGQLRRALHRRTTRIGPIGANHNRATCRCLHDSSSGYVRGFQHSSACAIQAEAKVR